MGKREQKIQNTESIKKNYTTKCYVRLEPGTFAARDESDTSRPKSRMKSEGVE